MREKGCVSHMYQVGEREFLLCYCQKTEVKFRTLIIPISSNWLFLFLTSQGYSQLFQSTQKSSPDHCRYFAGNCHVILDDNYDNDVPLPDPPENKPASGNPRESPTLGYLREWQSSHNMRDNSPITPAPLEVIPVPNVVPFDDIKIVNITQINSQTELQDVTPTQDHVVSTEINEPI